MKKRMKLKLVVALVSIWSAAVLAADEITEPTSIEQSVIEPVAEPTPEPAAEESTPVAAPEQAAVEEAATPTEPAVPEQTSAPEPAAAPAPEQSVEQTTPTSQELATVTQAAPANKDVGTVPPAPTASESSEITEFSVDTIDVESGGNWLKKRVIWEDAQAKFDKVRENLQQVLDSRMQFFTKRSDTDRRLNRFFVDIGFAQGELDEIIDDLLQSIELNRQQHGTLPQEKLEMQGKLLEKKDELAQLRQDIKSISDFDEALDTALEQLITQINRAAEYEKSAWQNLKDIGQELSDEKARELYYEMDADAKNIDAIYSYITGPFAGYFNTVVKKISEYETSIKTRLESLKQSGIELKKQLSDIEKKMEQAPLTPVKLPKKTGWGDYLTMPLQWIGDGFRWLLNKFGWK